MAVKDNKKVLLKEVFPVLDRLAQGMTITEEESALLAGIVEITQIPFDNPPVYEHWDRLLHVLVDSCQQLRRLDLSDTGVSDLSLLSALSQLQNLDLSNTGVSDLSPLSALSQLQSLIISSTGVSDLSALSVLKNLKLVFCRNLRLTEIPQELVRDKLELYLDDTTLVRQPSALFRLPSKTIRSLYYDRKRVPVREGKVIFLGESGVGKTHTIRRILAHGTDEDFDLQSTPGIDIRFFSTGDGTQPDVRFWDFGGQEIMQSMHQCFLTERSCYVVVVSNREAQSAMPQARKWLRTVAGFSRNVSVLLAVNQWNNVHEERNIDMAELRGICPKLADVVFYSASGGSPDAFRGLTDRIMSEVQTLDSVQLELPESWAAIREELLHSTRDYISLAEYRTLCEQYGLSGDDEAMEDIRMWLLEWFNDMGVCFSYHKNAPLTQPELTDYKVLSPKWLTNGIFRIINNGAQFADGGKLTDGEIDTLLNEPGYLAVDGSLTYKKPEERRYVLEVMRRFSRSYRFDDECEYIPELLPGKRPSDIHLSDYAPVAVCLFRLTYLPKSLIHRLMIDMRAWNDGVQWRYGVRLRDANTALLVESKDEDGLLTVEVYARGGSEYRALFHRTRLLIHRYIDEMSLRLEEESVKVDKSDAYAQYKLDVLLRRYDKTPCFLFTATGGRNELVDFSLQDLLLPLFPKDLLDPIRGLTDQDREPVRTLNAAAAVYPYDTRETLRAVEREERFAKLAPEAEDPMREKEEKERELPRLARLTLLALRDRTFLSWLDEHGTKKEASKEMNDENLQKPLLQGINRTLYCWASGSPLFQRAVEAPDSDLLADALGPNEERRYQASYALLERIWSHHPELGLTPDYRLLSDLEHAGAYYRQYRDHLTHMFKVYLLGLYLYEKEESLQTRVPEDEFFPTWTLAALWHDMGYLIETEEGSRDGPGAQRVFASITEALSTPLAHLFPDTFHQDWERAQQRENRNPPLVLDAFELLRKKLSRFEGFGESVYLSNGVCKNPIKSYLSAKAEKIDRRSYYDHGIVSAMMLLFLWDALRSYMEKAVSYRMYPEQSECLSAYEKRTAGCGRFVSDAAFAIALHNIQKEENSDLNYRGVTISDFRIPFEAEPIAWLLRVCDEVQCWDRQRFNSPIENEKPSLGGAALDFTEIGDSLCLKIEQAAGKKLRAALNPVVSPYPAFLPEV